MKAREKGLWEVYQWTGGDKIKGFPYCLVKEGNQCYFQEGNCKYYLSYGNWLVFEKNPFGFQIYTDEVFHKEFEIVEE
jgi:hypothetical protein